jgi:hypothetical protein
LVLTHTAGFWAWQLLVAMALNCVVQGLSIAAYAARLAGARSGRVATAISLYNIFATTSRFASMLYMPMLGSLSDRADALGEITGYQWQLRLIVAAGAVGAVIGTLALPTFVMLYLRAIRSFERFRSIPKAALRLFIPKTAASLLKDLKFTTATNVWKLSPRNLPKDVLVLNTLVTSVYGIGIVSAAYASVLNPGAARTALLFSGLVNGIGAIAYNVVVDPTAAFITDQTVKGERSVDDVKALVTYLSFTAILGFMLSQLLLLPAAYVLEAAARLITGK